MKDTQDLKDVLTTAVEGGIGYWSVITNSLRDPDGSWVCVTLAPAYDDDFEPVTVDYSALRPFLKKGFDAADIDAGDADCIVQKAAFGKVVYG